MDPAFKLRCQHQEHDDESQRKGNVDCRRGFLEFPAQAFVTNAGFRRQVIHSQIVQVGQCRTQVVTIRHRRTDHHSGQAVDAAEVRVGADLLHGNQCLQWDQVTAFPGPQENLAEVFGRCPVGIFRLNDYIVFAASIDVSRYLPGSQHGLQGEAHVFYRDIQIRGPFPVDVHPKFRPGQLEISIQVLEIRVFLGALHDLLAPGLNRLIVRTSHHELDRLAETPLAQTRRIDGHGPDAGHISQLPADFAGHLLLLDIPLFPGYQAHDHERVVLFIAESDDSKQTVGYPLVQIREQCFFHLPNVVVGVFHR